MAVAKTLVVVNHWCQVTAATFPGSDYRPDIDGLRAVAVLAVIGFHADVAFLHGGFVGVDVFFVISGYLISGIIFRALARGTFSFADFYTRRINRIFPALLIVLCASIVIGWLILYSREFALLGKHVFGGATFLSNIILWREAGYFDSPLKPFLHLWSLGVEEQFYLIWPALVWLTWRSGREKNLPRLIGGLIIVSFVVNVVLVKTSFGTAAFYSPVTRFWQLMSGALLAWAELRNTTWRRFAGIHAQALATLASIIGLTLLAASFVMVGPATEWPGSKAIVPVVGTLLLMMSGPENVVSRRILANQGMVAIGLISYPLYLWHWPLIVFARLLSDGPVRLPVMVAVVAASFILAAVTYRAIERPIRFGRHRRRSARALLYCMGTTAVLGLVIQQRQIHPRLAQENPRIANAEADWEYPGIGALDRISGAPVIDSIPGDTSRTVAFFGDSHIQQYWPRVVELSRTDRFFPRVFFLTYGSCPPLPGVNREGFDPLTRSEFKCDLYHVKALERLMKPDIKTVVIGAYWEHYLPEGKTYSTVDPSHPRLGLEGTRTDQAFAGLETEVRRLTSNGKKVFIILSNPTSPSFHPRSMFPSRLRGLQEKTPVKAVARSDFVARASNVTSRLRGLAARTGAAVIDPVAYLCTATDCPTVTADGAPIYMDDQHLRATFARHAATFIDVIFTR